MTLATVEILDPNGPDKPFSGGARAGDLFFSSGITAVGHESFAAEVNAILDELERRLGLVGAGAGQLVKVNAYLSDAGLAGEFNQIYMQRITGQRPPRTTVVTAFPNAAIRLEIDAVAYIGG